MRRRQIYEVSHGYIDGLFQAKGCARGSVPSRPGPRYERLRPNELWHIDIKGPFFINLAGRGYIKTWLVGLVDDHSRPFPVRDRTPDPAGSQGQPHPGLAGRV